MMPKFFMTPRSASAFAIRSDEKESPFLFWVANVLSGGANVLTGDRSGLPSLQWPCIVAMDKKTISMMQPLMDTNAAKVHVCRPTVSEPGTYAPRTTKSAPNELQIKAKAPMESGFGKSKSCASPLKPESPSLNAERRHEQTIKALPTKFKGGANVCQTVRSGASARTTAGPGESPHENRQVVAQRKMQTMMLAAASESAATCKGRCPRVCPSIKGEYMLPGWQ
mmetsp:Transcript_58544/g.163269  ORF Transcript_58544/g.163269 Transcript_58544/m.163269 type:complete len:224 (-) Transcript_58544:72-743(-)